MPPHADGTNDGVGTSWGDACRGTIADKPIPFGPGQFYHGWERSKSRCRLGPQKGGHWVWSSSTRTAQNGPAGTAKKHSKKWVVGCTGIERHTEKAWPLERNLAVTASELSSGERAGRTTPELGWSSFPLLLGRKRFPPTLYCTLPTVGSKGDPRESEGSEAPEPAQRARLGDRGEIAGRLALPRAVILLFQEPRGLCFSKSPNHIRGREEERSEPRRTLPLPTASLQTRTGGIEPDWRGSGPLGARLCHSLLFLLRRHSKYSPFSGTVVFPSPFAGSQGRNGPYYRGLRRPFATYLPVCCTIENSLPTETPVSGHNLESDSACKVCATVKEGAW